MTKRDQQDHERADCRAAAEVRGEHFSVAYHIDGTRHDPWYFATEETAKASFESTAKVNEGAILKDYYERHARLRRMRISLRRFVDVVWKTIASKEITCGVDYGDAE